MQVLEDKIADYLSQCRDFTQLTDGGWLDTDSFEFEILHQAEREVTVAIRFVEVVTESRGGRAERLDRRAYLAFTLDAYGDIVSVSPGS